MAELDNLIDYAYLRKEVEIPSNIEDAVLDHPIKRGQEMLRMLMCDEFYQDFLANFKNNTLSAAYQSLLPYIKQFVAWQAYAFWTVKANFAATRSGFRVHSETNSVAATDMQMATLIKDAKYQAEYYKKLMTDFIQGHVADYPLFCDGCKGSVTGNSFHITAVKKKHKEPQPYGRRRGCESC